ncbi:MAG: hypothetical protein HN576_01125, partial [Bacteriovoracaceae bacterium]|nr:hypothetical protein [Bacteriovoracaceae bacterium]
RPTGFDGNGYFTGGFTVDSAGVLGPTVQGALLKTDELTPENFLEDGGVANCSTPYRLLCVEQPAP